jgi:S1-C subfamily serine protease
MVPQMKKAISCGLRIASGATRFLLVGAFASLVAIAVGSWIEHSSSAASVSRPIEPRFSLGDIERSNVELFERASPSVVQVTTITGADDPAKFTTKTGSGFIWDASGNIVTNEHVVQGADTIAVWLATGEMEQAKLVGAAPNYDLAVIRLTQARPLPPAIPIGTSKDLRVGQFAYAIGSPFGLDQSLTTGVVSALKRQLPTAEGRQITNIIQTDAAILPGSSGGPLLDSAGRLIGVNTISYALARPATALGFAIPVDLVNRVVPELINNGRIPTPGIGIVPETDQAASGPQVEGVLIGRIKPGSPAERAGLLGSRGSVTGTGDVITAANGQPVRSVFDLTDQLEKVGIGLLNWR